jgi:hypothetical protein
LLAHVTRSRLGDEKRGVKAEEGLRWMGGGIEIAMMLRCDAIAVL